MAILERARVDLVLESARGRNRQRGRDVHTRRGFPAARSTDGDRAAEFPLAFLERERRGEKVFRLDADPFERAVEHHPLAGTQLREIGALRLGCLRDDRVVAGTFRTRTRFGPLPSPPPRPPSPAAAASAWGVAPQSAAGPASDAD